MIELEINGIENLLERFDKVDVDKALDKGVKKSMLLLENNVKRNTPVDTGLLRNSFETTFKPLQGTLNNFREYAIYVQEGTRYMEGRDFLGKGIEASERGIQNVFNKEVDYLLETL